MSFEFALQMVNSKLHPHCVKYKTQSMTIYSKIIAGEIPAYVVAESNEFLAFLDITPLAEGHVLVIPKKEVDYIFDLDDEAYTGMQIFARIVATALKKAVRC